MAKYSPLYPEGLSDSQAEKRQREFGDNALSTGGKIGAGKILASQFKNLLTLILLASTVVSLFMGEYVEAVTIIAIVLINALLGFFQEFKTERTLELLKALSAPNASVLRNGRRAEIPASQLVPDDIVLIEAGCRIPADGFVLEAFSLAADESLLTGESIPVEKRPCSESAPKPTPGRADMLYMGTLAASGRGKMAVSSIGMSTEMGAVAGMLNEINSETTPLQRRLASLSKYIAVGCLAICTLVTLTGILRGEEPFDMFLTGLSLSVAAIPEGLTAVITISLGLAVSRMLARNALIRRLHAVETLGCSDVICSDKTGTLTENRMTVREIMTRSSTLALSGDGRSFLFGRLPARLSELPEAARLCEIATCCNNARPGDQSPDGQSLANVAGEPTEAALLIMAARAGIDVSALARRLPRQGELPFDSNRKMMSVTVRDPSGKALQMTKGAPDLLIARCDFVLSGGSPLPFTEEERRRFLDMNRQMASRALRVLGFAFRERSGPSFSEEHMVFVGLAGMLDPPRAEAFDAVQKCRRAGIRPIMITGDHRETASAVARELHILSRGDAVLTGAELDAMNEEDFLRALPKTAVFARVSPAHKLKIVRALKKQGHIVAMTGDGVNDAPAVKEADIGVAMGKTGTDVTREASSVVLLDDNFATLVAAVEEGRIIYRNIRKFIRYLLSCNIGEVVTMFFGMLMGMPVILLPIQILMVNLVTDGLPAIALGLDPPQEDVMKLRPRARDESIFSQGLAGKIVFRGLLIGLSVLAVFTGILSARGTLPEARTAAFLTLVFTQLAHVFECKSESRSLIGMNVLNNIWLILAALSSFLMVMAAVYIPALAVLFDTVPLSLPQMLMVIGASVAVPMVSAVLLMLKGKK